MPIRLRRGFTLIELLIVVAIIAILAAIAVPNFLEAQTRAKVSRAAADMRSITTAIEAYSIDHNRYPPNDGGPSNGGFLVTPIEITTPVAYMTSRPRDPFAIGFNLAANQGAGGTDAELVDELFGYWRIVRADEAFQDPERDFCNECVLVIDDDGFGNRRALQKYGRWHQVSVGPDKFFSDPNNNDALPGGLGAPGFPPWGYSFDIPYDPTNGTISFGNIIRTQIQTDGARPDPDLI